VHFGESMEHLAAWVHYHYHCHVYQGQAGASTNTPPLAHPGGY